MKKSMVYLLMGLVATLVCGQRSFAEVSVGNPAPDFTLSDTNGNKVSLSDFKGKFVVLEWVNFGCPFVIKHYGSDNMQQLQSEMTGRGVVWLSVNSSAEGKQGFHSPEEVNLLLAQKNAHPSAYLLDTPGTVGKLYGAMTTPHMFIVNPAGVLIYQGAIDDKPTFEPADIPGAKNYVRQSLNEAMSGSAVSEPVTKSYGCSVKY